MKLRLFVLSAVLVCTLCAGESVDEELTRLRRAAEAAMSQSEMNETSGELAKYWDRALEKEERRILAKCDAKEAELFKDAQKKWRAFRAADVELEGAHWSGGSVQPLMINSAYAGVTEHRVEQLRHYPAPG